MRTDKGYRYSIIFAADTDEKVRVGEFLESCGHRKGQLIVEAVSAYLDGNPDIGERLGKDTGSVKVVVKQTLTREEVEKIVRDAIKNSGMTFTPDTASASDTSSSPEQE